MKVLSVVSSRLHLMKVAGLCEAVRGFNAAGALEEIEHAIIHTGPPCQAGVSEIYFNDLDLPEPSVFLGGDLGSHSLRDARLTDRFESVLLQENPDVVLVLGGADSAVACALATKRTVCSNGSTRKPFIPKLGHIEGGSRSFDRQSPKNINRILIDAVADFLFTAEESAAANLAREGIPQEKIHLVGNVRVDNLLRYRSKAEQSTILSDLQLERGAGVRPYAVLTLHRSENLENKAALCGILSGLLSITQKIPVIFPAHPRALRAVERGDSGEFFIDHNFEGPEPWDARVRIRLAPPLGYLDYVRLISRARMIFTDSKGVREECMVVGAPCIVLGRATERSIAPEGGASMPAGSDARRIAEQFRDLYRSDTNIASSPESWDGGAALRIVRVLAENRLHGSGTGLRGREINARDTDVTASEQTI